MPPGVGPLPEARTAAAATSRVVVEEAEGEVGRVAEGAAAGDEAACPVLAHQAAPGAVAAVDLLPVAPGPTRAGAPEVATETTPVPEATVPRVEKTTTAEATSPVPSAPFRVPTAAPATGHAIEGHPAAAVARVVLVARQVQADVGRMDGPAVRVEEPVHPALKVEAKGLLGARDLVPVATGAGSGA